LATSAVLDEVVDAVLSFDSKRVTEATRKALAQGIDPVKIIEEGLAKGLRIIGKKFEDGELFIMHLIAAAQPVQKVTAELLQPEISKSKVSRKVLGKVVIGTVAGDIHDIGKNIVAAMLLAMGFEVYDLGKDVAAEVFIKRASEVSADIIASSALLSTTLPVQHEIVETLVKRGIRDSFKVMVGGAPVTEDWANEIGADGYGVDSVDAVRVAKRLLRVAEQGELDDE